MSKKKSSRRRPVKKTPSPLADERPRYSPELMTLYGGELDRIEADLAAIRWARVRTKKLGYWVQDAQNIEQQIDAVQVDALDAFMQREIDRSIAEGRRDPLERARAALYLLLVGNAAKAELIRRREQHVGVAFVICLLPDGLPEPLVTEARERVRRSVGKNLGRGGVRRGIIERENTGRTQGEPMVQSMMESEAVIQTARRLRRRKRTLVDALLDALDGHLNLMGKRTANRLARRERIARRAARVVRLVKNKDGKLPEHAGRWEDPEFKPTPDAERVRFDADDWRGLFAELAQYHRKLAKLPEAMRRYTDWDDIAHHCGFRDRRSFTRVLRDFRRSHERGR